MLSCWSTRPSLSLMLRARSPDDAQDSCVYTTMSQSPFRVEVRLRIWAIATGAVRFVVFGQLLLQSIDDLSVVRVGSYVLVFQRISLVIVEFIGSNSWASVPGVAVAAIGDRVIFVLVGCRRREIPFLRTIFQQQQRKTAPIVSPRRLLLEMTTGVIWVTALGVRQSEQVLWSLQTEPIQ